MGDFEDVFGAGADADDIINYYSSRNTDYDDQLEPREEVDSAEAYEYVAWMDKMRHRGFVDGPSFSTFDDLSDWLKENVGTESISRRIGDRFFVAVKEES